jgi:hypothetical protein
LDFKVTGAGQLADLAKRCRQVGDKDITRELYRGLNRATKPPRDAVKRNLELYLPDNYAAQLRRRLRMSTRRRTGRNPGLSVAASTKVSRLDVLDRGRLRHPLFRNRRFWFEQPVKAGFFTDPMRRSEPQVTPELQAVMEGVLAKLDDS